MKVSTASESLPEVEAREENSPVAGAVRIARQRSHEVKVYANHSAGCNQKRADCRCPKQLYVKATQQRLSANTRSWEEAERKAQEISTDFDPVQRELKRLREKENRNIEVEDMLVSEALAAWIEDLKDRVLPKDPATGEFKPTSLEPYLTVQRQFGDYLSEHGILNLSAAAHPDVLEAFRKTWRTKYGCTKEMAREKKQMKLAHFFTYCVRRDWLKKNSAAGGKKSKIGKPGGTPWVPMVAFSDEQMETIYAACDRLGRNDTDPDDGRRVRTRQRALIALMVASGMAIKDAVTLGTSELREDGEIETRHRAKTNKQYITGVPPEVAALVRSVEPGERDDPDYFFKGTGKDQYCTKRYYNQFEKLWQLCDPPLQLKNGHRPHPHMFRCTFAVRYLREHLEAGFYPLSKILGTTVAIIERHYAPMVPELQEKIREMRRAAFAPAPAPQPGKLVEFKRRAAGH